MPIVPISKDKPLHACMGICSPATYHKNNTCLQLSVHLPLLLIAFIAYLTFVQLHFTRFHILSLTIHSDIQCVTLSLCYHVLVTMDTMYAAAL